MARRATLALAVLLTLAGCERGDQGASVEGETLAVTETTPSPEPPSPADELLQQIRSCEVREIIFAHDGVAHVKLRGRDGYTPVRLGKRTERRVSEAAFGARCEPRIVVGIE